MIDVVRRRVKIKKGEVRYAPIPLACVPHLDRLEGWVRGIPAREQAARLKIERDRRNLEQAQRPVRRDAVRDYHRRLKHHRDTTDSGPDNRAPPAKRPRLDLKDTPSTDACPECATSLAACKKCKLFSCPRKGCAGQGSDLLQRCADHSDEIFCQPCCRSASTTAPLRPPLATCPSCMETLCSKQLRFCGGKESSLDSALLHPPGVVCCVFCEQESEEDGKPFMFKCVVPHWYGDSEKETVCYQCVEHLGERCEEHPVEWWCGHHLVDRHMPLAGFKCPSCSRSLCPSTSHPSCATCHAPSSCKKCLPVMLRLPELNLGEEDTGDSKSPLSDPRSTETSLSNNVAGNSIVEFDRLECP
ncbi:hypothetical protein B0T19DRAFT_287733 [Cercophora scortea]|uniref:Uncharacterized protein n=1 Tax=Cercophora scortea TaxID=314031 RepID=A0AAE0I260_9PEZI|nr:hypothetical protein B0T19DRAFT_287733 [Cercophora scortea]